MTANWSIKKKIASAIGVGMACAGGLALVSFLNTAKLLNLAQSTDETYRILRASTQVLLDLKTVEGSTRGYFLIGEERYLEPYQKAIAALPQDLGLLKKLTGDHASVLAKANEMEQLALSRVAVAREAVEARAKHGADGAAAVVRRYDTKKMMDGIMAKQGEIEGEELRQLQQTEGEAATWALVTRISNAGGGLIALGCSLAAGMWLIRSITRPLDEATGLIESVAAGDLTAKANSNSGDEFGQLIRTLNEMVARLGTTMSSISTASTQVTQGSDEMRATAQRLAEGATEQAAAAEETTSAMEQMASSVHQNADNAKQTDRIASKAAVDAKESGEAVAETVRLMKTVAGTIGVIEEIARKTDLLALNAAVEAARAGEHGRGFAVVASEVRKLAERSQAAASEIGRMTNDGVRTAETAGQLLAKLVPDIQKTAELVREIAAASAEQNSGTAQVNQAIQQLDQVIQQNASAAEQMAATAEELSGQSQSLRGTIAYFKVEGALDGTAPSPSPAMRRKSAVPVGHRSHKERRSSPPPAAAGSLLKMNRAVQGAELDLGPLPLSAPGGSDALDHEFGEYKG